MKALSITKSSILTVLLVSSGQIQAFDEEAAIAEAKAIASTFATALKQELQAAMKAGGPVKALNVCNIEAMPITAQSAQELNASISRVSLKNRNMSNVPNEWQRVVLEEFDSRVSRGEDAGEMISSTVVESDGKKQLRFMKALPTGGVCLACHGQELSSEVQTVLKDLYPDDKATGYSLGENRGAIVVIKDYER
ncbi:MAG: DUF3365 domain-containing protein [Gammaproteobacteria bacterium]|nr:DUF3365 domain-containing protein [Gammaproteobacteria bacterium]